MIASDLSYHSNHEVAQVCLGHVWRKRVAACSGFEEFLLLIRILESYLDRQVSVLPLIFARLWELCQSTHNFEFSQTIHSCESASKRGKTGSQKAIQCSIRNSSSGNIDHFVLNKKNLKGCWMSNSQVDLLSLVCRRQSRIQRRLQRVREKHEADKEKRLI